MLSSKPLITSLLMLHAMLTAPALAKDPAALMRASGAVEGSAAKPSIDLDIPFERGSAVIGQAAEESLQTLGHALSSAELRCTVFLIAAHTDATGDPIESEKISLQRAEAIAQFLVDRFRVAPTALIPVGYGTEQLKNGTDPSAADNNRVQIINLSRHATAECSE